MAACNYQQAIRFFERHVAEDFLKIGERDAIAVALEAIREKHQNNTQEDTVFEPVRLGHWSLRCDSRLDQHTGEYDEDYFLECSECKRKVRDIDPAGVDNWIKVIAPFPYCHCGAKMHSEEESSLIKKLGGSDSRLNDEIDGQMSLLPNISQSPDPETFE